jgi:hypothetical protein
MGSSPPRSASAYLSGSQNDHRPSIFSNRQSGRDDRVGGLTERLQGWTALSSKARHHHRRPLPGNLSARSIQLGTAVAPSLPQRLQRMRGPKDGTVASSGQSSILTARSWPQCWQVACSPRTPCRRILPSVMGRPGSSSLIIRPAKNAQGTKSSGRDRFPAALSGLRHRVRPRDSDLLAIMTAVTWRSQPHPDDPAPPFLRASVLHSRPLLPSTGASRTFFR